MSADLLHDISAVDADLLIGDCAVCGPGVRVLLRLERGTYRCKWQNAKSSVAARRRKRARERALRPPRPPKMIRPLTGRDLLTVSERDAMLAAQGGVCAICGGVDRNRALAVDHCHKTGRIRGLLCGRCNTSLGLMADDIHRLQRAIHYLASSEVAPRQLLGGSADP